MFELKPNDTVCIEPQGHGEEACASCLVSEEGPWQHVTCRVGLVSALGQAISKGPCFQGITFSNEYLPKGHDFSWNKVTSGIQPAGGRPPHRHASEQQ